MKRPLRLLTLAILGALLLMPLQRARAAEENYVDNDYPGCIKIAIINKSVCLGAHISAIYTSFFSDVVRRIAGAVTDIVVAQGETNTAYINQLNEQSAISGFNRAIAMMYENKPADTGVFLADLGQSLGFIPKQALAQNRGVGFSGLAGLLNVWKGFRNIAYALLAFAMVVIGFMVMFRKKIDPKTVVTVQNAMPRIVVTLILVTFSYAIAGLLIDFMYVTILAIATVLSNAFPSIITSATGPTLIRGGMDRFFYELMKGGAFSVREVTNMIFYGNTIAGWFTRIVTLGVGAYLLMAFIIAIALLFGYIRIFFMLLSAYIQLIIAVIIGPLQILLDVFPGSTSFSSWIKNFIANLSVFPITIGMLMVGMVLARQNASNIWTPPPLAGEGATTEGVTGLIALGILLTIPSVANAVKEALKAKSPLPSALGAVTGMVSAPISMLVQGYHLYTSHETMKAYQEQVGLLKEKSKPGQAAK